MSGKKLTVKEIIKALEYWKKFDNEIDQMLSGRFKDDKMLIEQKEIVKITLNLFDLINRQKAIIEKSEKVEHFADKTIETANAEIERLKKKVEELSEVLSDSIRIRYKEVQSEAVKEFAERLKEKSGKVEMVCSGALVQRDYTISEKTLDNLLKEMVGDSDV